MLPRLFGLGDPAAYLDATGRAARVAVDTAYDRAGVHPDTPSTHLADAVGAVDFSQPTGSPRRSVLPATDPTIVLSPVE